MKRILLLGVALVVGALVATGASAAQKPAKTTFRQTLAAKLGEQLHKPAGEVLAALKAGAKKPSGDRRERREERLRQRLAGLKSGKKTDVTKTRDEWAAAVAKPLGLDAAKVTAALRALIAERLDSLVGDGWLTTVQRDAKLACFDGAASCKRGAGPGLGFLRVG
jgi:hypothetical protein